MQTVEKALKINLDTSIYGTIAEIGAGQEVARNFFQAGGAAGTIAKTMSAYDMQVSDSIYGQEPDKRYVTQNRVEKMIHREYDLVIERLSSVRPESTRFFAFADTVAAKGYKSTRPCHGWMGIKYQISPDDEPCEIVLHVIMKDKGNLSQQRALGILGVNLIYGAFYLYNNPEQLIEELLDTVGWERIEIDMIRFTGQRFSHIDNRLMALHLVKLDHTRSVMFTSEGENVRAADFLYKKNIILLRGTFRPITNIHLDIIKAGEKQILKQNPELQEKVVFITEISMSKLVNKGNLDKEDFLGRVDTLNALGFNVQITNFTRHFQLKRYLAGCTKEQILIMLGARKLRELFNEHYYTDLDGGINEGLGVLFAGNTQLFVYPKQGSDGTRIEVDTLQVDEHMKYLFKHFLQNNKMIPLTDVSIQHSSSDKRRVSEALLNGDGTWREKVPEVVYRMIKERGLFGFESESKI